MGSLSPVHWVIVLVIVLLLFGPGRLAGVGKGLGEGIRSFKKGLNASGFLKVEKFLTKVQREEFRDAIAEFTGESEKAGGTMVLEGPVTDYKTITLKPSDAELLDSRQFSVEDVCRWFNTPPPDLNIIAPELRSSACCRNMCCVCVREEVR